MEPARTSIEALSRLGFLALVFSLAFMKPSLAFAGQRIAPTDLLFPFTAILFLAACVFTKRQFEWKPVYWLFFAYFAAMAISTIFSPNTTASVSKLAGIGYLLGLAVIACESIRNENDVRLTIYAWLAGLSISVIIGTATAVSFYSFDNSLLQPFTYHQGAAPAGAYRRISSTFISPAMFCNYLNVGLFLAFIARTKGWLADKFVLPLIIAIVLCSLLTVTIGIGVVILSGGIILWLTLRREQPLAARVSLVTGSLALIPFAASAFFALQPHKTAPYSFQIPFFGYEVFPSPRLLVWQQAFQTFLADPLTGIGTGMPVARVAFQNADGSMSLLTDEEGGQETFFLKVDPSLITRQKNQKKKKPQRLDFQLHEPLNDLKEGIRHGQKETLRAKELKPIIGRAESETYILRKDLMFTTRHQNLRKKNPPPFDFQPLLSRLSGQVGKIKHGQKVIYLAIKFPHDSISPSQVEFILKVVLPFPVVQGQTRSQGVSH
jgi:hypothetical protein